MGSITRTQTKGTSSGPSTSSSHPHLVLTVPGIRTYGHWQQGLAQLLEDAEPGIVVCHYTFGTLSGPAYLNPLSRFIERRHFQRELIGLLQDKDWGRVDIVAHSFGTHLLAWSLLGLKCEVGQIHTIILAGSVLRARFPWRRLLTTCVKRLVNECGTKDCVLLLNKAPGFFRLGLAGRVGFYGVEERDRFINREYSFGHSGYFPTQPGEPCAFMKERWVPLLTTNDAVELSHPGRRFHIGFVTLATLAELITALLLLSVIALSGFYYREQRDTARSLQVKAEANAKLAEKQTDLAKTERTLALARQLSAESDLLRSTDSDWTAAALLAAESMSRAHLLDNDIAVRDSARLTRSRLELLQDEGVALTKYSPNGQYMASSTTSRLVLFEATRGREVFRLDCGGAYALAFTADSRFLAAVGHDSTLWLIDTAKGRSVSHLNNLNNIDALTGAVFADDGRYVAIRFGAQGNWVRIFDTFSQVEVSRLHILASEPASAELKVGLEALFPGPLAFSPDDQLIAQGDLERISLFDVASGRKVFQLNPRPYYPSGYRISFTRSGLGVFGVGGLISAGLDGIVAFRVPKPGKALVFGDLGPPNVSEYEAFRVLSPSTIAASYAVSTDGRTMAVSGRDYSVPLLTMQNGAETRRLYHAGEPKKFSGDGRYLGSAFRPDETIRVFDVVTGAEISRCRGTDLEFSPDGKHLATWGGDNGVRLYDLSGAGGVRTSSPSMDLLNVALTTDGRFAAAASYDGASVFDTATGKQICDRPSSNQAPNRRVRPELISSPATWLGYASRGLDHFSYRGQPLVFAVALNPSGRLLVTGGDDKSARVFDVTSRQDVARIPQNGTVWAANFSTDGRLLAVCTIDGETQVFETVRWTKVASLSPPARTAALAIAFSATGQYVAVGYADNAARVFDLSTRKTAVVLKQQGWVTGTAFSPDGQYVATASLDHLARVFRFSGENTKELLNLPHDVGVRSVAFAQDAQSVLTVDFDNVGHIFDAHTGLEVSRVEFGLPVWQVALPAPGRHLIAAVGSRGLEFHTSLIRPQDMIDELCSRMTRNLTAVEWAEYVGAEVPYRRTCPSLP